MRRMIMYSKRNLDFPIPNRWTQWCTSQPEKGPHFFEDLALEQSVSTPMCLPLLSQPKRILFFLPLTMVVSNLKIITTTLFALPTSLAKRKRSSRVGEIYKINNLLLLWQVRTYKYSLKCLVKDVYLFSLKCVRQIHGIGNRIVNRSHICVILKN